MYRFSSTFCLSFFARNRVWWECSTYTQWKRGGEEIIKSVLQDRQAVMEFPLICTQCSVRICQRERGGGTALKHSRNWDSFMGIYDPRDQQSNICSLWLSLNELTHNFGKLFLEAWLYSKKKKKRVWKSERERWQGGNTSQFSFVKWNWKKGK